jgi:ribosomal subunit interface protein
MECDTTGPSRRCDLKVTITERHCEVPRRVLARTEKTVRVLDKFDQRATHADVIYTDEKHTRKVEVIVHVDREPLVAARGEGEDFGKALTQVLDRMKRILKDQREKRVDHQGTPLSEGLATK